MSFMVIQKLHYVIMSAPYLRLLEFLRTRVYILLHVVKTLTWWDSSCFFNLCRTSGFLSTYMIETNVIWYSTFHWQLNRVWTVLENKLYNVAIGMISDPNLDKRFLFLLILVFLIIPVGNGA